MKKLIINIFTCAVVALFFYLIYFYTKPKTTQEKLSNKEYKIITIEQDSLTFNYIK